MKYTLFKCTLGDSRLMCLPAKCVIHKQCSELIYLPHRDSLAIENTEELKSFSVGLGSGKNRGRAEAAGVEVGRGW